VSAREADSGNAGMLAAFAVFFRLVLHLLRLVQLLLLLLLLPAVCSCFLLRDGVSFSLGRKMSASEFGRLHINDAAASLGRT